MDFQPPGVQRSRQWRWRHLGESGALCALDFSGKNAVQFWSFVWGFVWGFGLNYVQRFWWILRTFKTLEKLKLELPLRNEFLWPLGEAPPIQSIHLSNMPGTLGFQLGFQLSLRMCWVSGVLRVHTCRSSDRHRCIKECRPRDRPVAHRGTVRGCVWQGSQAWILQVNTYLCVRCSVLTFQACRCAGNHHPRSHYCWGFSHTILIEMIETCVMNSRRHATWKSFTYMFSTKCRQEILCLRQDDRCFGWDRRHHCSGPVDVFGPRWPEATWQLPLAILFR